MNICDLYLSTLISKVVYQLSVPLHCGSSESVYMCVLVHYWSYIAVFF